MPLPPIIWFYGLSGSGKSTQSRLLFDRLQKIQGFGPLELLDGDEMRAAMPYSLGYSEPDRRGSLNVAMHTAYFLRKNGVTCIVATMLFRHEHRLLLKQKLPGAVDVFCNASFDTCRQRDPKGVYNRALALEKPELVGLDIPFETPQNPDINLNTESDSIQDCFNLLWRQLSHRTEFKPHLSSNAGEIHQGNGATRSLQYV